jgi:hypothetical protein
VDAGGADGEGDVGAGVDVELGGGAAGRGMGAQGGEEPAGESDEGGRGEVFLAELYVVDAGGGPGGGEGE